MAKKIKLGDEVVDTVTGFTGIAIAKTEFLHGCFRITVQPKMTEPSKLADERTFDEPQLKVVAKQKAKNGDKKTGGPVPYKVEKKSTIGR